MGRIVNCSSAFGPILKQCSHDSHAQAGPTCLRAGITALPHPAFFASKTCRVGSGFRQQCV